MRDCRTCADNKDLASDHGQYEKKDDVRDVLFHPQMHIRNLCRKERRSRSSNYQDRPVRSGHAYLPFPRSSFFRFAKDVEQSLREIFPFASRLLQLPLAHLVIGNIGKLDLQNVGLGVLLLVQAVLRLCCVI